MNLYGHLEEDIKMYSPEVEQQLHLLLLLLLFFLLISWEESAIPPRVSFKILLILSLVLLTLMPSNQQPASLFGVSQWDCDLREYLVYADLPHRIKAEPNQPPPQWQEKLTVSILVRNSSFTDVLPMELYVMLRLSGSWYICYKEVIKRLHKQRLP